MPRKRPSQLRREVWFDSSYHSFVSNYLSAYRRRSDGRLSGGGHALLSRLERHLGLSRREFGAALREWHGIASRPHRWLNQTGYLAWGACVEECCGPRPPAIRRTLQLLLTRLDGGPASARIKQIILDDDERILTAAGWVWHDGWLERMEI